VGLLAAAALVTALLGVGGFRRAGGTEAWRFGVAAAAIGILNAGAVMAWLLARNPRVHTRALLAIVAFLLNVVAIGLLALPRGAFSLGYTIDHVSSRPGIEGLWPVGAAALLVTLPALIAAEVVRPRHALGSLGDAVVLARPAIGRRTAVLAIFLLSGAAGLIYEVVWARQLVLVFGNTTQAISAILTGYFGGLAIGSVVGGRIADRVRSPLRMYGILELGLVVVVLITPLLFRSLHEVYRAGYGSLETMPTTLALIRYALALAALAPATILMGATLPSLSRYLAREPKELGGNFGRLYAINTLGAVVGTIVAGLVLIELLGLSMTLLVGAIGSATAGLAAIALDLRSARQSGGPNAARESEIATASAGTDLASQPIGSEVTITRAVRRLALTVAFVSGLTSLGYQVLWTRLLASGSGNATYVFTLILATFLVGLSIGAVFVTRRLTRTRNLVAWLGFAQLATAIIVLAGLPILTGRVPAGPLFQRVLLIVLPGTLALGVTLPMASNLIGLGAHRVGRDAGLLLGANTIGAIAGTFLIPFAAIPWIGSIRALVLLALINAGLGLMLVLFARDAPPKHLSARTLTTAGALVTAVATVALLVPSPFVTDPGEVRMDRAGAVYASMEDEIAAVQAGKIRGWERLYVGGIGMTALTVDAKLMPLIPEMVRPSASRMLVIAFGMGSSYRTALRSGLDVDGVELVPSVPKMLNYFQPDAAAVLANPHGRLIIADGRNYVELSDRTYDIVMVDPPPPIHSSGTSVLYSREFYAASAARLAPDGVMMEWMPTGQSIDEFKAHVRTFASVFPNVLLVFGPATGGMYITGSRGSVTLDPQAIAAVLQRPGVIDDLNEARDAPVHSIGEWEARIPKLVFLSGSEVRDFVGAGPLITDDRPMIEYFVLRRLTSPDSPRATQRNLEAAARDAH
jgi:spermidine synthase